MISKLNFEAQLSFWYTPKRYKSVNCTECIIEITETKKANKYNVLKVFFQEKIKSHSWFLNHII